MTTTETLSQSAHDDTGSADARGLAVSSFVLGIVSVASGWILIVPLTGLILGLVALRQRTAERTLTIWGIVLNGAMLLVSLLAVALLVMLLSAAVLMVPLDA